MEPNPTPASDVNLEQWLPLISAIIRDRFSWSVRKHAGRPQQTFCNIDRDDLFQEGVIALMRALETYDPRKGVSFKWWAYTIIKHTLVDVVERNMSVVTTPVKGHRDLAGASHQKQERFLAAKNCRTFSEIEHDTKDEDFDLDVFLADAAPHLLTMDEPPCHSDQAHAESDVAVLRECLPAEEFDLLMRLANGETAVQIAAESPHSHGCTQKRIRKIRRKARFILTREGRLE